MTTPFIQDTCDFFDTDSAPDSTPIQQRRASHARKGTRKKNQCSNGQPHSKLSASTPLSTNSVVNLSLLSSQESQSSQSSVRKRADSIPLRAAKKSKWLRPLENRTLILLLPFLVICPPCPVF